MTSDEVLEWPVEKSGYEIRVTGGDEEIVLVRTDIGGEQTVRWGHGAFLDAPNGIGWSNYDEVLKKGKAVWVAPAENLEGSRWCETYEPMKEQGLYEQFANLKRSQKPSSNSPIGMACSVVTRWSRFHSGINSPRLYARLSLPTTSSKTTRTTRRAFGVFSICRKK